MRAGRFLALLVLVTACVEPHESRPVSAARDTGAETPVDDEPLGAPAVAAPTVMPARYLRTLERDPGGYDAAAPPGGSTLAGRAGDLLLGDLLFHSPHTLGLRARAMGISCDTCHPNGAAHVTLAIDGLSDRPGNVDVSTAFFRAASDDGAFDPVNVPSLRGCRYTAPYGNDGRTASLSEFIANVVTTEFDGTSLSPRDLAALTRYVQDLDFLPNANLDARSALTAQASDEARRGAAVFEAPRAGFGGESCATCHPGSSFFRDGRVHRMASGSSPSPHAIDDAYETPTLLGTAETAPYFHDGRFATLADVVAWFDESYSLRLGDRDRASLVAYLEAVGHVDRPRDDRPLARRLDQTFSYLSLLGEHEKERRVWIAAVDAVLASLDHPPDAVRARVASMRLRLERLRADGVRGTMTAHDAADAKALRGELARLAADWAGATP